MNESIVTSIELARQLMKTWDLPNSITSLNVSIGITGPPEITVSYLVSKEDATGFLHLMKHYNLVEKIEQSNDPIRKSEI